MPSLRASIDGLAPCPACAHCCRGYRFSPRGRRSTRKLRHWRQSQRWYNLQDQNNRFHYITGVTPPVKACVGMQTDSIGILTGPERHDDKERNPNQFWNGETGQNWVSHDALMEAMLQPLGEAVMDSLSLKPGEHVLDIGCGCGHTSLSLADRVGAEGSVTGIDISAPMLAVATQLAAEHNTVHKSVQFLEADAQTHRFTPESYDAAFSRFGVMFFEDPVAAFTNIHASLRPSGRLAFCCWQPRAVNPFMTVPAMAALELLPAPPEIPPRTPGPFAFEEADYVAEILTKAGFEHVAVTPLRQPLTFGRG